MANANAGAEADMSTVKRRKVDSASESSSSGTSSTSSDPLKHEVSIDALLVSLVALVPAQKGAKAEELKRRIQAQIKTLCESSGDEARSVVLMHQMLEKQNKFHEMLTGGSRSSSAGPKAVAAARKEIKVKEKCLWINSTLAELTCTPDSIQEHFIINSTGKLKAKDAMALARFIKDTPEGKLDTTVSMADTKRMVTAKLQNIQDTFTQKCKAMYFGYSFDKCKEKRLSKVPQVKSLTRGSAGLKHMMQYFYYFGAIESLYSNLPGDREQLVALSTLGVMESLMQDVEPASSFGQPESYDGPATFTNIMRLYGEFPKDDGEAKGDSKALFDARENFLNDLATRVEALCQKPRPNGDLRLVTWGNEKRPNNMQSGASSSSARVVKRPVKPAVTQKEAVNTTTAPVRGPVVVAATVPAAVSSSVAAPSSRTKRK